jgi:iron(II)-dependent oxidoreductase
MGSDPAVDPSAPDDEFSQHVVYTDAYWIMRIEVTNEQYARCVNAGVCRLPENDRWHFEEFAREPVTGVNWFAATAYAAWVGGRLPTEAEWEKACRGNDSRIYTWGNSEPDTSLANYARSGLNNVVQVGSYPSGANGMYDMAGNVWERTSSKYMPYPFDPQDGREEPEGADERTLRGGGWNITKDGIRCANRIGDSPHDTNDKRGLRVVVPAGS